jgi:hypothetical protein
MTLREQLDGIREKAKQRIPDASRHGSIAPA